MWYIVFFIIGFIAVSFWSFWLVIHPPKITIDSTPRDFQLPAEEITLLTQDGLKLNAWFIPSTRASESSRRAIILIHGYPAEKADMLNIAAKLYPDFALFLFDLRYFGKSEGYYTTLGIKERLDLRAALNFLEERGYKKVGVFGFSLGGATALLTAAQDSRIRAVGAYASFSDLRLLGREAYSNLFILKYPLVELMLIYARLFFEESLTKVSPVNAAKHLRVPIFLIHTKMDEQISFRHAELLREALKENPEAEFYFPEQGLHGELPYDFEARLKNFFQRHL